MSGIYISGMEMPTTCAKCPLGHFNAKRYAIECYAEYHTKLFDYDLARHSTNPFCPLIPVPDHGDLIDRDKAVQDLRMDYAYAAAKIVALQATIIPADKEGEA